MTTQLLTELQLPLGAQATGKPPFRHRIIEERLRSGQTRIISVTAELKHVQLIKWALFVLFMV